MIHKTDIEIAELLTTLAGLCQSSRDAQKVAELVQRQHRTHQQSIGRFIQSALKSFALMYEQGNYDLRNTSTCEMASAINDQAEEYSLPFI